MKYVVQILLLALLAYATWAGLGLVKYAIDHELRVIEFRRYMDLNHPLPTQRI